MLLATAGASAMQINTWDEIIFGFEKYVSFGAQGALNFEKQNVQFYNNKHIDDRF